MNEEEAVSRVEEWLAGRGEGTGALRVRREYVVRATGGWNVTYNTVGWLDGTDPAAGLFPSPVAFVPDDGGEIRLDLELMAVSAAGGDGDDDDAFTRWTEVVDPEFDPAAVPGLPVPKTAIVRWEQQTLYGEPTGAVRANPEHRPGPRFSGRPKPESAVETLLGYLRVEWITPEEFVHWMLDLDVLAPAKDGHLQVRDFGDAGARFVVYTSEAQIPAEYTVWQRVQPRVLLRRAKDTPGVGLLVNPGRPEPFNVYPETLRQVADLGLPAKAERPESVGRPAYLSEEYAKAYEALREEYGQDLGEATSNLRNLTDQARDNGLPLSTDELVRYARAATLSYKRSRAKYDGRPLPELPDDLFANGLVTHFYDDGEPRPSAWNFGKFYNPTIPVGSFAYPRLVGAYVGFALGDALGSGGDPAEGLPLGGLTRQLLFHTESVIRGLDATPDNTEIPASLPAGGRPDGWVAKATAAAGPAPAEFSAMLATALAATVTGGVPGPADDPFYAMKVVRELVGSAAGHEVVHGAELLVNLFRAQLAARNGEPAVANFLAGFDEYSGEVGELVKTVLDLRNDVDGGSADDVEQFDSIGDGRTPLSVLGRALFAAAKRGHDPEAALTLAARGGAVTGALTGAMVGARLTVPGLPETWLAAFGDLGVVDNMAGDAYYYFNRFGLPREPEERRRWDAKRYPRGDQ
ncbi:YrhB domain-containing protein [Amycolatopsis orientalis]|uniref:YrhB domain-containing protein n=1 Tax=Amycolatopsis orientalis TaxID=31958 RepID=UPI00056C0A94|nr:YrhB domain-containing protein [Amycolatopsis orientalis]